MKRYEVEPIKKMEDIIAIENYLAQKSERNRLIFVLGINTGLRVSDILSLNIKDVEGKTKIKIVEKKTGKSKAILFNEKLQRLVKEFIEHRRMKNPDLSGDDPLFIGKKHCRLFRSQVYRVLNEACKTLKIDINVGTHTMRKSFGYHFYKKYNDVVLLQKIFNHFNPAITLRYIGIMQDEIDESYKNFIL